MESRLEEAVAVYAMVASRLAHLLYQSRATPDSPASVACTDDEWKALHVAAHRSPDFPRLPPPLSTAVIWWPALGASSSVEATAPGVKALWRGLRKLGGSHHHVADHVPSDLMGKAQR